MHTNHQTDQSHKFFIVTQDKKTLSHVWADAQANPYNSPISHLLHSELAKYNLQCLNYPNQKDSPELNEWMSLIAKINQHFYKLEQLINHPHSSNPKDSVEHLIQQVKNWQDNIQNQLQEHRAESTRIHYLLSSLSEQITHDATELLNVLDSIKQQPQISIDQIRYLHAPHDLSFFTPSIGRWLSEQMHHVLQTGLRGAYHLSPTPWYNVIQVHPSIQALSNAKKNVSLKSFALSGIAHSSPFHAHHPDFFKPDEDIHDYKISKNNPFEAEKFIAALEGKSLDEIHYSASFLLFIPRVLAILLFELPLLLVRLSLHILNAVSIMLLMGHIPEFIANAEKILAEFHENYSPYNVLQKLENQWQSEHWEQQVAAENLTYLKKAQIQNNVFVKLGHYTQACPVWESLNQWFEAWWHRDSMVPLSAPNIQLIQDYLTFQNIDNHLPQVHQHTAYNRIETAVDIVEEIAMVLDNQSIDALFRTNPGPALACFNLSMFGFASLLVPSMIPSQLVPVKNVMHLILNDLCHKFMGHAATENYLNIQLSAFLFWQLSFYGSKLLIDIADPTQRLWYQEISQFPDSFILSAIVILGLGVLEAYLPIIPESIPLTNIPNPLAIFYNGINQEALNCLKNGTAPFSLTSLAIISVKSLALYINLLMGQEFSAEVMGLIYEFIFHPEFLISLHKHFKSDDEDKNTHAFIEAFCQDKNLPGFSEDTIQHISSYIDQLNKEPKKPETNSQKLLQIIHAFERNDPMVQNALNDRQFAMEMYQYLSKLFDEYHLENPNKILDKDAFLLQFYSNYCEYRTLNIIRLLEVALLPIHLLIWLTAFICQSDLWATYGCKKSTEDLYIITKLIYSLAHPLAEFIIILYNYTFLNTLRIIPFIFRTSLEKIFGRDTLEPYTFYQALHFIDDSIQSFKIHYTVNQLLWPLQILFANLSFYSGRFFDFSSICHSLIEKIMDEENLVENTVKNMYNCNRVEVNNNNEGVTNNVRL